MSQREVPVYIFSGFMDSGKTTLIHETLYRNHFADELDSVLVISCEDGDEEYDEENCCEPPGSPDNDPAGSCFRGNVFQRHDCRHCSGI